MNQQHIAVICHEANRFLCQSQHDYSQEAWRTAPKWQRDSALHGVEAHVNELVKSGGQVGLKPSASHESWYLEKLADGWTYGELKDVELKTHPCMVDFDELPPEQQAKDFLFGAIVKALFPILTPEP